MPARNVASAFALDSDRFAVRERASADLAGEAKASLARLKGKVAD